MANRTAPGLVVRIRLVCLYREHGSPAFLQVANTVNFSKTALNDAVKRTEKLPTEASSTQTLSTPG